MDREEPSEEEEIEKEPRVPPQQEAIDPIELALTLFPVVVTGGMDLEFRKKVMWEVHNKARMGNRPSQCQGFCAQLNLKEVAKASAA